jgi:hypothetical protein
LASEISEIRKLINSPKTQGQFRQSEACHRAIR